LHAVRKSLVLAASFVLMMSMAATTAAQSPVSVDKSEIGSNSDNIPSALSQNKNALKQEALRLVLSGQATPTGKDKLVKLPGGQVVQLAFEGEDQILTFLGQFGEAQATHNHGALGTINHDGTPGPLHNQIPQPDRTVDNTTIWTADFNQSY
jgi:immune inhibitor A